MIKHQLSQKVEIKHHMREGEKSVVVTHVWDCGTEIKAPQRLFAHMNLEVGASIGTHEHVNEEEVFYIIKGTAEVDDNGVKKILNIHDSMLTAHGEFHSIKNVGNEPLEILAIITLYPQK